MTPLLRGRARALQKGFRYTRSLYIWRDPLRAATARSCPRTPRQA